MRSVVDLGMVVSCLALSSALVAASAIAPDEPSEASPEGSHAPERPEVDRGTGPEASAGSSPPVEVELVERTALVRASDVRAAPEAGPGPGPGPGPAPRLPEPGPDREPDPETEPDPATEPESASEDDEPVYVAADGTHVDAERIRAFLDGRGAPLADQAEAFVTAAVTHDVDPRVVVGIAVAESSGGEALPPGSHNAWGWGGSGPKGLAAWASWPEAIDTYTGRLGALYDTDQVDESFARTYCPPNWRWWLDTVTWVIDEI